MDLITVIRNDITKQINTERAFNYTTEQLDFAGIDIEITTEYVGSYTGSDVIVVEVSGYASTTLDTEERYYIHLQYDRSQVIPLVNGYITQQIRNA